MAIQTLANNVVVDHHDLEATEVIRNFCNVNNLVGLRDISSDIMALLNRNIEFGAVFLSEQEDFPCLVTLII